MTDTLVDIKNCNAYRGQNLVLHNINLNIQSGERLAILGPNGCGKTTLLKLITREIYPKVEDTAYLELFGQRDINLWQLRKKIGYVSHETQGDYRSLATGKEVLLSAFYGSVGIHQHQSFSPAQHQQATDLLAQQGLSELTEKRFLNMSSGQQRRLLMARASIHQPELVLLDEPTNGLDVSASFKMLSDMRHLSANKTALMLITHHLQEIVPEINRVILMQNGQIVADGDKASVLREATLSEVFATPIKLSNHDGYYQWRPA